MHGALADLVDLVLASFSAVQLILAVGAAYVAFTLRKTFEGGIFEKAWKIIGMAPLVYAAGQVSLFLTPSGVESFEG